MAERPLDLSIVTKGFKEFSTAMKKTMNAFLKLGKVMNSVEVPMERVLVIDGYRGNRRWLWRVKERV